MSIDLSSNAAAAGWVDMPSMQEARERSSSCTLAGHVYVFCGYGQNGRLISIEKLRLVASDSIE